MELLERDKYLNELESMFNELSSGNGFVVFVSGEAGIGKTSLVENFTQQIGKHANILWGACDALFTPRPLGPLYDIAAQLKNGLLDLLNKQTVRSIIFTKFLQELQENELPNVVILEDVHWADESTLDLIKFLGRRATKLNVIFIITFRDDELGSNHPLRFVLGDIPSQNLIRIKLPLLSQKTVEKLAYSNGVKNLYELTSGNPFLITELLSSKEKTIPSTIKDSVLSRMLRLSDEARDLAELVSVIPNRAEKIIINNIIPLNSGALEECINSGILRLEEDFLFFRHELSRMAVEESLSESKRQKLNEKVLQSLLKLKKPDNYLARIIHHAVRAQNKEVIIKYAESAAHQASQLGAHSLAAEHYKNALKFADELPLEKQIDLYEGRSYECYLTGQVEEGIKAGEIVLKLVKQLNDPEREAENYRKISRMLWYDCDDEKGEKYLNKAIDILERLTPGKHLAMAYSNKSQTYMLREETGEAIEWGNKAFELARKLKDENIQAHTLNNIGTAKMFEDDDTGVDLLKKSLELSLKNDFYEHASRAYTNLGSVMLQKRRLTEAFEYFLAGSDYCNDKDLYTYSLCMDGHFANTELYLGTWDKAVELAGRVFRKENIPFGNKIIPLMVIGIVRARRNDPGALSLIEESDLLAPQIREIDKIVVVKSAKAEAYWLQNRLNEIIHEVESVYNEIKDGKNSWEIGQIAYWLWKGNRLLAPPPIIARPYLLQIKGNWKAAAKLWEELHCPYEQAMALSEGDEKAMKRAVEIFDSMGASATSQLIKHKMRESGMRSIPKGPRKTTRSNPAGLTFRQLEVLNLLGKGLSNIEIGNRLYISAKTVDHHISAIFSKLNIHSRLEAAAFLNSEHISKK